MLAALDLPEGQNLFLLDTDELARRLSVIPAIRGASVTVALPDEVRVDVAEREGLLVWQVGADRYLVDEEGLLFGRVDEASPGAAAELPVVDDQRVVAGVLALGATLDPVLLDAARRLGSLRPADLGTAAAGSRSRSTTRSGSRSRPSPSAGPRCSVLHPDAPDDRAHPGPGPAAAEHARPGRRGDGRCV